MKTSPTSLLGEKSRSLLQDVAFLPEDLILLAQACELLGNILMRTLEQIRLLVLGGHRLNVDFAMPRSLATRSTLRPLVIVSRTASRLNSFVNRLCLFLLIATSSILHRGWLSTFAGQVQSCSAPCCWRGRISRRSACRLAQAPLPFLSGFEFNPENPTLLD